MVLYQLSYFGVIIKLEPLIGIEPMTSPFIATSPSFIFERIRLYLFA